MANIIFRQTTSPNIPESSFAKGNPLSNEEVDGNFRSLNDKKVDIDYQYADPSWLTSLNETKVLPSQTENTGKILTTDGTTSSWKSVDELGLTDQYIALAIALG